MTTTFVIRLEDNGFVALQDGEMIADSSSGNDLQKLCSLIMETAANQELDAKEKADAEQN